MAYQEAPIDRAHNAAHYIHAIDDLLSTACDGGADNMRLVHPEHLAHLIGYICRELDEALLGLEREINKPKLRTV